MMKAFILFAFFMVGFGTVGSSQAQAQTITKGSISTILLQIADEIKVYDHTQEARVSAYLVINGAHKTVGMGIQPQVSQYLIWQPSLITDDVILFQISDFLKNGLRRDTPTRILKPAYDRLVALLQTLKNSRL